MLTRFTYNIGVLLYGISIKIASLWSAKAKAWTIGRKDWKSKLKTVNPSGKKLIWFHCASLGEFEQGRNLIEKFRSSHPNFFIAISFFSPSGFEIRKNYKYADWVGYLPLDTAKNAEDFVALLKPDLAIFIKYEFWHNYLWTLQKSSIPYLFTSTIINKNHYLLYYLARPLLKNLKNAHQVFVQDEDSKKLLEQRSFTNVKIAGDGRIDRVIEINNKSNISEDILSFSEGYKIFIIGSNWPRDDQILIPFLNILSSEWKIIIAPHNLNEAQLKDIESKIGRNVVRLSALKPDAKDTQVLLIDNIGHLSKLYSLANLAYIGGGFGKGIHNILEPMAAGIPVIFGPNYKKFREAIEIITQKGGFCVSNTDDLRKVFQYLSNDQNYNAAKKVNKDYLNRNKGATQIVYDYIFSNNLLKT